MGFAFRLERVLSVRRIQEEEARERHEASQRELQRSQEVLAAREARLRQALDELDALKRRDELTSQALYLHSLHASDRAEETGARLLEAHQAREALERLREREHASWRHQCARAEARQMDEIAVTRHRAREEENHGP